MRDRHLPRLCGHCHAPMARQEDTCWRCGTQWVSENAPATALRVIPGGAPDVTHIDDERWVGEGGRVDCEAVEPPSTAARG